MGAFRTGETEHLHGSDRCLCRSLSLQNKRRTTQKAPASLDVPLRPDRAAPMSVTQLTYLCDIEEKSGNFSWCGRSRSGGSLDDERTAIDVAAWH